MYSDLLCRHVYANLIEMQKFPMIFMYSGFFVHICVFTTYFEWKMLLKRHLIPYLWFRFHFHFFFFKLFLFSLLWHLVVVMFTRNHLVDLWNYAVTIFYNKIYFIGFFNKTQIDCNCVMTGGGDTQIFQHRSVWQRRLRIGWWYDMTWYVHINLCSGIDLIYA